MVVPVRTVTASGISGAVLLCLVRLALSCGAVAFVFSREQVLFDFIDTALQRSFGLVSDDVFASGHLRSNLSYVLACGVQALGGIVCLLDTLDLALDSIYA